MKHIKLMADYECYPLWDMDVVGNIDPANLSISDSLKDGLICWADDFTKTLDGKNSGFKDPTQRALFNERGKSLAKRLQLELGGSYQVIYSPVS